jgi:polyisoprenoid-binding protein YceI
MMGCRAPGPLGFHPPERARRKDQQLDSDRIRRRWIPAVLGASVVIVVGGALILYFAVFSSSSPKKLSLSTPNPATPIAAAKIPGQWTVVPASSTVGYRVREKLFALPAPSDAVGRTSAVTGGITLQDSGGHLLAKDANFSADVTTLKSDQSRRDNYIKNQGLESNQFPKATFASTADITIPDPAQQGQPAQATVVGNLNIHGVSHSVTIPLKIQLSGSQIQVVGSIAFPFSEFNMTPPSIGGFVSVTDNATLEFSLILSHS